MHVVAMIRPQSHTIERGKASRKAVSKLFLGFFPSAAEAAYHDLHSARRVDTYLLILHYALGVFESASAAIPSA